MSLLSEAFITAQNHALRRAPWALERLRGFAGRQVVLACGSIEIRFAINDEGYLGHVRDDAPTDVRIEVPLEQLPALATGDTPKSSLHLVGDADLAETTGFVLRNLRWDLDEDLSRLIGDVAAHRLGTVARGLRKAHSRAWEGARDNAVEFLTEEAALLVTHSESEALMPALLGLRDDLARCEKRLERLTRAIASLER